MRPPAWLPAPASGVPYVNTSSVFSFAHRIGLNLAGLLLVAGVVTSTCAQAGVVISKEDVNGVKAFRVATESATYVFDRAAGALISMIDRDGHDWISFRPEGTPGLKNGADGWYRGFPNTGSKAFGHTRRTETVSTTNDPLDVSLSYATIEARHGEWHATWDFFAKHAKITIHGAPESYWLLYEGTPGGALGPEDTCWRANGVGQSCSEPWSGDIVNTSAAAPDAEWVYFSDGRLDRSLFVAHPDDQILDSYFPKHGASGGMTVFGFGREPVTRLTRIINVLMAGEPQRPLLDAAPQVLVFGLVEATDFDTVKAEIDLAYGDQPDPGHHMEASSEAPITR